MPKISGKFFVFLFIVVFGFSLVHMVCGIGVTNTVSIGGAPWGVSYDSGKNEVFVVTTNINSVLVLSDSTNTVVATIPVGQQPYRSIYDSAKGEIFVTNYGADSVSVISDDTNTVVATVPVGSSPASFAYDSGKGEVFVANSAAGTVSVISDSTNTVVATVTVGSGPYDLAYDSAKGEVFVANSGARSVSVISDTSNTVVATIPVGSGPLGVAYDSAKSEIFVANSVSGTVSVISDSTNTVVATVTVGTSPAPVVYDSAKGYIFVVNRDSSTVSVISDSTNEVIATVPVGASPYGADYDSGKGEIYVANKADGTLSIISDSSTATSPSPSASTSPTPITSTSPNPTSSPPSSSSDLSGQVWVPSPVNAVATVGVSAVVMGVVALISSGLSTSLSGISGAVAEKITDLVPEKTKEFLAELFASKRKVNAAEKSGPLFRPTKTEIIAYVVSIIVLGVSFSYVKVVSLSQIWELLPIFLFTSFIVGFVQKFFSIIYLRRKGVWSEHAIWPLGLILFLFTTFAFKVPFSSPTRSVHTKKFTEHVGAIVASFEILISLAFGGLFFLLLSLGYVAIGSAGLSMCVIGSFFCTFPVSPLIGKEIFNHSKPLWAGFFLVTLIIFSLWILML
jgi:YVTN family beta-propeller protein